MEKSNEIEIGKRVDQISEWLLEGESRKLICQNMSKNWNISGRQVDRYIKLAKEKIIEILHEKNDIKYRLSWHFAIRHRLLKMAIDEHEINKALKILDSLAKMEGLFDPALQEKLRVESDFYKDLKTFPIKAMINFIENNH